MHILKLQNNSLCLQNLQCMHVARWSISLLPDPSPLFSATVERATQRRFSRSTGEAGDPLRFRWPLRLPERWGILVLCAVVYIGLGVEVGFPGGAVVAVKTAAGGIMVRPAPSRPFGVGRDVGEELGALGFADPGDWRPCCWFWPSEAPPGAAAATVAMAGVGAAGPVLGSVDVVVCRLSPLRRAGVKAKVRNLLLCGECPRPMRRNPTSVPVRWDGTYMRPTKPWMAMQKEGSSCGGSSRRRAPGRRWTRRLWGAVVFSVLLRSRCAKVAGPVVSVSVFWLYAYVMCFCLYEYK
jgi:hypothetical protein